MKTESTFSPSKFRSKNINLNNHCKVGRLRLIFLDLCHYLLPFATGDEFENCLPIQ